MALTRGDPVGRAESWSPPGYVYRRSRTCPAADRRAHARRCTRLLRRQVVHRRALRRGRRRSRCRRPRACSARRRRRAHRRPVNGSAAALGASSGGVWPRADRLRPRLCALVILGGACSCSSLGYLVIRADGDLDQLLDYAWSLAGLPGRCSRWRSACRARPTAVAAGRLAVAAGRRSCRRSRCWFHFDPGAARHAVPVENRALDPAVRHHLPHGRRRHRLLLVLLTTFLTPLVRARLAGTSIHDRVKEFYACMLLLEDRHARRVRRARPVPVLHLLGSDARSRCTSSSASGAASGASTRRSSSSSTRWSAAC